MSFSAPTLSGTVPNPATQPLEGALSWTESLTAGSTAFLLHCDGTNGATTFPDSSGNGNVVTAAGMTVSTTNPEFGTGSALVALTSGANTEYMACPIVAAGPLDLNTGADFTLEFSVMWNDVTGGAFIGDEATLPASGTFGWIVDGNGIGSIEFLQYYSDNTQLIVGSAAVPGGFQVGTWYQCAVVSAGGVYTVYIDGVGGTPVTAAKALRGTEGNLVFGYQHVSFAPAVQLDEIRITNSALYTSNYTPATAAFPSVTSASLLCHFDVYPFVDSSGNFYSLTSHGSPTQDTLDPMFGAGDAVLKVRTNYLGVTPTSGDPLDLGSSDWTIEFWLLLPSAEGGPTLVDPLALLGNAYTDWLIFSPEFNLSLGGLRFITTIGGTEYTQPTPSAAFPLNTWHSFAFCRQGRTLYAFFDGVMSKSVANYLPAGGALPLPSTIYMGNTPDAGGTQPFRLDELRVTKGTALYTADYTPSGPFPDPSGGSSAPGYDIYRDGVSIATVGAVLTYTDNVPTYGTYTYNVAAYDPTIPGDVSPESNTVPLTYQIPVIGFPNCIFDEAIYGGYFGGQLNLVEFTYMPGRTPFEEGATNLIINRYKQQPTDSRQRGVDFTQFVVPGELLQTVAVTGINAQGVPQAQTSPLVTPLVITNLVIDPVTQLKFAYTASGGQDGIEYTVQFTTTTNIQTETLEEIFSINIMIEDAFP